MGKYKCGHIIDENFRRSDFVLPLVFEEWRDTRGYKGDKLQCWDCWLQIDINRGVCNKCGKCINKDLGRKFCKICRFKQRVKKNEKN